MAIRYAVADGNWSDLSTWDGDIPDWYDDVYANGFFVNINQTIYANLLSNRAEEGAVGGGQFYTQDAYYIYASTYGGGTYGGASYQYCLNLGNGSIQVGNAYGFGTIVNSKSQLIGNVYGNNNLPGASIGNGGILQGNSYGGNASFGVQITCGTQVGNAYGGSINYSSGTFLQGGIFYGEAYGSTGYDACGLRAYDAALVVLTNTHNGGGYNAAGISLDSGSRVHYLIKSGSGGFIGSNNFEITNGNPYWGLLQALSPGIVRIPNIRGGADQ